jgi:hypothetical protein
VWETNLQGETLETYRRGDKIKHTRIDNDSVSFILSFVHIAESTSPKWTASPEPRPSFNAFE